MKITLAEIVAAAWFASIAAAAPEKDRVIRDPNGAIIGRVSVDSAGHETVRNQYGAITERREHRANSDGKSETVTTRDPNGKILAQETEKNKK